MGNVFRLLATLSFVINTSASLASSHADFTLYGGVVDQNLRFDNAGPQHLIRKMSQVKDIILNDIIARQHLSASEVIVILAFHGILTTGDSNSIPREEAADMLSSLISAGVKVVVATEGLNVTNAKENLIRMDMKALVSQIHPEATVVRKRLELADKKLRDVDVLGPLADTNKKVFVPWLVLGPEVTRAAKHIILVDDTKKAIIKFQRDRNDYPRMFAPNTHFYYLYAVDAMSREERLYPTFYIKSKLKKPL